MIVVVVDPAVHSCRSAHCTCTLSMRALYSSARIDSPLRLASGSMTALGATVQSLSWARSPIRAPGPTMQLSSLALGACQS